MFDILLPTVGQGLLWALMALGVFLTFRILDFADLTVEGTFPLGGAVAAAVIAGGGSIVTAFVLAAMLALTMCGAAFAEEGYSVV